jgi:hypothetical protein
MKPSLISFSLVHALAAACFAFAASSCSILGSNPKLVGSVTVASEDLSTGALARFDGDTLVVIARADMTIELYEKPDEPVLGPLVVESGYVFVWSRSRDEIIRQKIHEPLAAWVREQGVLRPGEAEALGLVWFDTQP